MKINEILELDADQPEKEMSPYIQKMKNSLVDYLSSLNATGAQKAIPTKKMVGFLRRMGYDATPEQIDDLLSDTAFGGDPEKVNVAGKPRDAMKGRDPEFNKKKVSSMAQQQIRKSNFDHNDFGNKDWRKGGVI